MIYGIYHQQLRCNTQWTDYYVDVKQRRDDGKGCATTELRLVGSGYLIADDESSSRAGPLKKETPLASVTFSAACTALHQTVAML